MSRAWFGLEDVTSFARTIRDSAPPLTLVAASLAALVLSFLVLEPLCRRNRERKAPPLGGPPPGGGRAAFAAQREDAFLSLVAAHGRSFRFDGVLASADPALLRPLLNARAHSLTRSPVYRLIAAAFPLSDGMLFAAGGAWRARHALLTPLFAAGHVRAFSGAMAAAALVVAALHERAGAGGRGRGGGGGGGGGEAGGKGGGDSGGGRGGGRGGGSGSAAVAGKAVHDEEEDEVDDDDDGDDGAALLAAARAPPGAAPLGAPAAAGRGVPARAAPGGDLLSAARWTALRTLLAWGAGLDADAHGAHARLAERGYACACGPPKRLAAAVDAYARLALETLPRVEARTRRAGRWCAPAWAVNYARVRAAARAVRAAVDDVVALEGVLWSRPGAGAPPGASPFANAAPGSVRCGARAGGGGGAGGGAGNDGTADSAGGAGGGGGSGGTGDGAGGAPPPLGVAPPALDVAPSPLAPCPAASGARPPPLPPPSPSDTPLSRLVAAGWGPADIASELNHLHGAHKAAAFTIAAGMAELAGRPDVRARLRAELVAVCGEPARGAAGGAAAGGGLAGGGGGGAEAGAAHAGGSRRLAALLAHLRAGGGGGEGDAARACSARCGWRLPSRADLEGGRLPVLRGVWRETLRRHVVSMGTMRRTGPPGEPAARGPHGEPLAPGTDVLVLLHAVHHDPAAWGPHAHWWLPERWDERAEGGAAADGGSGGGGEGGGGGKGGGGSGTGDGEGAGRGGAPTSSSASAAGATPGGAPSDDLPAPNEAFFMPFLDGLRRCAGLHTAELQFAVTAFAWVVLADVRAVPPAEPRAGAPPIAGAAGGGTAPPREGAPPAGAVVARRGALAWVADAAPPPAAARGRRVRLAVLKKADMFSAFDGPVRFTARVEGVE